ncbi:MAG: hypothetical protein GEU98_22125 [Pseudonocardiaceae bacterium]|nr:hypothetical protein [Pseudonocardiaceae bacterium]
MIAARCRPHGPWQRLLPGVILLSTAPPNRRQLLRAALTYAGDGAMITGLDALRAHGARARPTGQVHVLLPADRRLIAHGFVHLERTTRPQGRRHADGLSYAPPARAALDAARREPDADELRRLLALPVCHGLCTVSELRAELDAGSQRGSAAPREALASLGQGTEPAAQVFARRLVSYTPIPAPRWDVTVRDGRGRELAEVTAWWDEVALAWTVGAAHPRTRHELAALSASGVVAVHTAPARLHGDPDGVIRELSRAFLAASKRKRPPVRIEPDEPRGTVARPA